MQKKCHLVVSVHSIAVGVFKVYLAATELRYIAITLAQLKLEQLYNTYYTRSAAGNKSKTFQYIEVYSDQIDHSILHFY